MKNLFFWLLVSLALPAVAQSDPAPLKIVTSETHGLYSMLESLIGVPDRYPEMVSTFRGRVGNWGPVKAAADEWKRTAANPDLAKLSGSKIAGEEATVNTVLERLALESNSAEELADRAENFLGTESGEVFRTALLTLQPTYRDYWWRPSTLDKQKTLLLEELQKANFPTCWAKAQKFYSGSLPSGDSPTLALIVHERGLLELTTTPRGHFNGSIQVLQVVVGESDHHRAGRVFAGLASALWRGQSDKERARWQTVFEKHGEQGEAAYRQLDEALAAAIGFGWFDERATGTLNTGAWSVDPETDAYAKALYPIIKPALEAGRPPSDQELTGMLTAFRGAPVSPQN